MVRSSGHHRKRSRSKSASPERKRSRRSRSRERVKPRYRRSRSRDRERDLSDRDRHRRSHSRDRKWNDNKERRSASSKSKSKSLREVSGSDSKERDKKDSKGDDKAEDEAFDPTNLDKEEEQKRLEQEMQKRRERIERWRAERKKKELEVTKKEIKGSLLANLQLPMKKWTLEDDSDEEEDKQDNKENKDEIIEEEVDPLDAFMQGVQEEVRKVNKIDGKKTDGKPGTAVNSNSSGVVIVTGVAKKKVDKKKGELIEQNQDGLEYSSEEEEEDLNATAAGIANKQKKELAKVDHSNMQYTPFRKNFYVEVPEIARMTAEEVEAYKEELEGIRVKGKGCPKPIKTWAQCGVSKKELDVLKKQSYEKPTPIQVQAIPAIMSGRDLIGIAKTGSGKTLAFLLPMLRHIMDQPPLEEMEGPIAVIMTPTRELCMQIGKECKKFTKSLNLRAVCVYGGTGISEQIAELKRGAEIIVCTPGRMIDLLAANSGRVTNLKRVTYVVLDEADRMFDMGFEPQVMRIIENIRPDRQTVMFSATFPRQMEALARRILTKPIEIQVGGRSVVCKEVEQHVVILEEEQKFLKLLELLGHYQGLGSIIVFVDKQENADILLKDLMKASYQCMSLHGGIDQFDRDSTIVDFKSGKVRLLVATSVAARGLDVKHLILVVNYDCPNHYEDYVHRCGRTGRAGNKGFAYTFITPEQERYAGDIIRALELSLVPVPDPLRMLWDRYKAKQAAEGKKVHTGGGFSGKGFKFDEAEAMMVSEKKKFQKAALGLQDSDDEDLEHDIDQQIENMLAPKRIVKEIKAPIGMNPGAPVVPSQLIPSATDKLELARRLASRINMAKNLGAEAKGATQQAAEAILKGGGSQPLITAKTVAEQLAAKLNTKLNYQPKEEDDKAEEEQVETFRKYEEELEINDFPQQARWRVTSKEALAQISEYSEAGITVRGTYFTPGKPAPEGERKLYLAIESTNELAVSKAKIEITRLIKEELLKLQSSAHHIMNKARYKVV
ncbi:putative ATP-dependent RNA helicase DDX46 [Cryptotermes secundus]|uniref:Probable ATP-dependent RNA helicase DDX46 n=1 Tax=Cryptotermes secundus TaxID=105785 RepID=A0A2J7RRL6_9NEOP|nr:probable ATP-dependent RNA helicase DDX46 [Cryptotermes secundus]PNF43480.1 putative ATP-dependent RNA helicase DDX46 [Cryptotermes secundus]